MSAAFILLVLSAATGLVLGTSFSWPAIVASGIGLAILSAAVLQITGFGALFGIAIIVACLTVNQLAYVMEVVLVPKRGARRLKIGSWPTRRRTKRK
jgi:hypothetical protein